MTTRIYFKAPRGYFPYARGVGQGIMYRDGFYDSDAPIVLEAAERDVCGPQKYVYAIEELAAEVTALPIQPAPEPEPDIQCTHCPALVPAVEWKEHQRSHGREKRKKE